MKCTLYFLAMRSRPDRVGIREEWIQAVLLADGETIHNAFFDRGFTP